MTDKKSSSGKDDTKPGEKRPHATLDLRATEVGKQKAASASSSKSDIAKGSGAGSAKSSETTKPGGKTNPASSTKSNAQTPHGDRDVRKSGGGFFSHMAAGIIGATLTLVGSSFLPPIGDPDPTTSATDTSVLEQRLAALENAQPAGTNAGAALPTDLVEKLNAAEQRLTELTKISAELESLKSQQSTLVAETESLSKKVSQNDAPGSATSRLIALEQQLKTLSAAAAPGDGDATSSSIPQLAAITGRLADLERTLTNQMTALRDGVAQDVEKRIATTAEASVAAQAGTERMDRELSIVKTDTARFNQQLEGLKATSKSIADKLRVVQEETGTLSSNLSSLKDDVTVQLGKTAKPDDIAAAVKGVKENLAELKNKVESVVATEDARSQNAKQIVLSLELANLKRALSRGQSYATELESVKSAATGTFDFSVLEKFKNDGVPTLPKLQSDFEPLAYKIINAESVPADGSVFDQLLAGAKSVVQIRKVKHNPDDKGVEATVARMDAALKDGALGNVIAESKKLSPQAATPAQEWLDQVASLAQVNEAMAKIDQELKQSLRGDPKS
ncbi:MAG: hypothetical protein ACRBCJ_08870 [Hyphomicrobiaceae bacterium]